MGVRNAGSGVHARIEIEDIRESVCGHVCVRACACVCVCFVCVWCVMVAVNVEAAVNNGQSHDDDTSMPALRGLSAAWLGAFWHGREGTGT